MSAKRGHTPADMVTESKPRASRTDARGIARPRLTDALKQARDRRCAVLQGPAGCGKTTVLGAWRRELVAAGVDVAWVALGPGDDDVATFIDALLVALSEIDAGMVRDAAILAGRGNGAEAIESIAIALVRGMAAHRHDVALVFDDAHHLHDERIVGALQLLLDHGPPNLLCVFASRHPLPLSLARLRDQGQLMEIGFDMLRFTPEESAQLVEGLLDGADERQARALHALTDGWAAGLKLLCMDLRRQHGGPQVHGRTPIDEHVRDPQTFARYFDQAVLSQLSPADLRFFVRCALPEHFNAALCEALQDGQTLSSASADPLARLESQGFFMVPAGPRYPEGWWRLHPLLRDVVLARLDALPKAELRRLHTIAWHWFADHGMPHDAVHHALQAGEAQAAADLVEGCATDLFVQGRLRRLVGLVRQLPDALLQERTGLRLWMAWVQVYERRLDDCARSIAQLQRDMADADPVSRFRLTLLRGLYAVQCDDTAAAMAILPELREAPAGADVIALIGRRNLLTWIHIYRGDYELARLVQLEALPRTDGQPLLSTPFGVLAGRCLLGLAHAVEGQVIQAERIYRDVLFEADRRGASCADAGSLAAGLLGEVLYELNDGAGALRLLEGRLDVLERVSMPDTVVRVMLVMGRANWLAGRPLDALAYVEQIDDYAERKRLDRVRTYCLLEQLRFQLRRNEVAIAREHMAALEVLDARHADVDIGALSEIRVAAERARIEMDMHAGHLQSALARLDALSALCLQRGRVRRIPFLHLQAAVVRRKLGEADKACQHVREALRLGHRLGLVRTLLDAHEDVPDLLRQAVEDVQDDPVLGFYAERLVAAARDQPQAARPANEHQGRAARAQAFASLSPREVEIVHLLLQAMPNKKIARVLNLSLDTVKWHLKNCYGKLGVTGRDEVVERMRDLGVS
ncbi:LuxR C-terminal-related transcriptional regulator [Hydrogenophaga sp. 2FB]|uniref:LuxR C-terminal-related transcriptional regulator n=1 Tax=Hydrogenophaga sp. 2FB TaxID=2502187 RepID=UPI0010F8B1D3|nr:LuxR C-terminal-related transcriptional regulator [Hydrogenophaga sp. 2FB]